MFWTEPEGYQQWLNDKFTKGTGLSSCFSIIVLCVAFLFVGNLTESILRTMLGLAISILLIFKAINIVGLFVAHFNLIDPTEIQLDSIRLFGGENGRGRLIHIPIDQIISYKI